MNRLFLPVVVFCLSIGCLLASGCSNESNQQVNSSIKKENKLQKRNGKMLNAFPAARTGAPGTATKGS